jgi:hypothetical protein
MTLNVGSLHRRWQNRQPARSRDASAAFAVVTVVGSLVTLSFAIETNGRALEALHGLNNTRSPSDTWA